MNGRKLLDPRWHWLMAALNRLYGELEPDAGVVALNLGVEAGDGMYVSYTVYRGRAEIDRRVLTDFATLACALESSTVDAAPDDPL